MDISVHTLMRELSYIVGKGSGEVEGASIRIYRYGGDMVSVEANQALKICYYNYGG